MTSTARSPRWIDADAHVLETKAVWEYLDCKFRDRVCITDVTTDPNFRDHMYDLSIDGFQIPNSLGSPSQRIEGLFDRLIESARAKFSPGAGHQPAQYLKDMDVEGLEQVVIYPTLFLFVPWVPQLGAEFSAALARAYNDWIYDFCAADRSRLRPVAAVSLHDPATAIAEVKRCAAKGFVGVFVRPNPLYGRTLGHPDYHPFYRAMEEHNLPVGIHEGQLSHLPTFGADRTRSHASLHCMSHPFEQMAAMLSLVEAGVFDKVPKLQFLFLEAGTALWLPYWINRLDAERKLYRSNQKQGALPSEIFHRQCYITCESDDPYLPQTLACIGDERLLFSTDYPHDESPYPNSVKLFLSQKISEESRERIGRLNVRKAYPTL